MENGTEQLWQDLIESKEFDQLSNEEKSFVLGTSTESNFRLERAIIVESKSLDKDVVPVPLILPEEKKGIVIPLYQTILVAAASFVLAFFLFRSNGKEIENAGNQIVATTDTVYVEKLMIDTVIQTKTEYVQLAARKNNPDIAVTETFEEKPSAVLSTQTSFEADLSSTTLENKGKSASNDETLFLMEDWVGPN